MNRDRRSSARKTLAESLTADVVLAGRDPSRTFSEMMAARAQVTLAELSVLLAVSEAMLMLHRTSHWTAKSQSYFSDHKLYEMAYESLNESVDKLGERAAGMGTDLTVDVIDRAESVSSILREMHAPHGVPQADAIAERSLAGEFFLLRIAQLALSSMRDIGSLTPGIDNMLQEFCDAREVTISHLRRRTA